MSDLDRLFEIIDDDDLSGLKALIAATPEIVNAHAGRIQAIHNAAGDNKTAILKLLIQHGADVNSKDEDGRTPLHYAAEDSIQATRILLKNGADPNVYDQRGYTPMAWAILNQMEEGETITKMLRKAGAQYGIVEAAGLGELKTVRSILSNDPDVLSRVPSHETLLSMAWTVGFFGKREDRVEILKLLFDSGLTLPKEVLLEHANAAQTAQRDQIAEVINNAAEQAGKKPKK